MNQNKYLSPSLVVSDKHDRYPSNHQYVQEYLLKQSPQPPEYKKQVGRQFQTRQNKLKKAEARQEFAGALTLHRVSMQGNINYQQPPYQTQTESSYYLQPPCQTESSLVSSQPQLDSIPTNNSSMYKPATSHNISSNLGSLSGPSSTFESLQNSCPCPISTSLTIVSANLWPIFDLSLIPENLGPVSSEFSSDHRNLTPISNLENIWTSSVSAPTPEYLWPSSAYTHLIPEDYDPLLPNQALCSNLNLQDFDNLDTTFSQNNCILFAKNSSSSLSTSNPPLLPEETSYVVLPQTPSVAPPDCSIINESDLNLYQVVDDKELAEISSAENQHQVEWDATMNAVSSTQLFKLFKNMEIDPNVFDYIDESTGVPSWLNVDEKCLEQLDEQNSRNYSEDQQSILPQ